MTMRGLLQRGGEAVLVLTVLLSFVPGEAGAQVIALSSLETGSTHETMVKELGGFFPGVYFTDVVNAMKAADEARPYWASTEAESVAISRIYSDYASILLNSDILAFYGHPRSRNMGILGRYSIDELDQRLGTLAAEYEAESGGRGVQKAFYLIYGTVWPEGEIGILGDDITKRYIDYALKNDILVFLDHQIGRYDPVDSLKRMLPWLQYPNVHLALDPEWRTTKPMKEIGTVTADEINRAQQLMEDYIVANNIPGERLLVIHQFNIRMISGRDKVRNDFHRVRLVHCADGFGPPHLKRASYAYNAEAQNIPVKGFKLFYNFGISGAGYDEPMLSPRQVYALNPRPYVIMYQ